MATRAGIGDNRPMADLATSALGFFQAVGIGFSGWLHHRSVDHGERITGVETKVEAHEKALSVQHIETIDRFKGLEIKIDKLIDRELNR